MTTPTELDDIARTLATFGLDHVAQRSTIPWSEVDLDAVWTRVTSQRLTGLFTATLLHDVGHGTTPVEVAERIQDRLAARVLQLTTLEWQLVDLHRRLRAAGVPVAAVKGPALGRALYPEHWWRDFGDLDLLVPADAFTPAVDALGALGAVPIVAPPSKRAAPLLGKGMTLRHPLGNEIDLHHTLLAGGRGFGLGWDWWMADPAEVDIGGERIATTGRVLTALHLLAHLCIGGPRGSLHVARDVAQALGAIDPSSTTADELVGRAAEIGLAGLIQTGVARAGQDLGWRHPGWVAWAERHPAPASWSAVSRRSDHEGDSFGAVVMASFRTHRRPSDRLALLRAVAWPDPAHLADRGLTRRGYTVRLGRSVLLR